MNYVFHVMGMDSIKYGGLERFNCALSRSLYNKGYQSVFIYESEPNCQDYLKDLYNTHAMCFVSNARKHPIRFCFDFVKLIRRFKPVLVHAHFTKARFYAIPIAKFFGINNLFFTLHSMIGRVDSIKLTTRFWYELANKIAKVITVSDCIENVYRENWHNAQVKRIYLGVSQQKRDKEKCRLALGISADQMVILTVANFNYIKGLDVLVKSIAILQGQGNWNESFSLYIVGQSESDIIELQELIISLNVKNSIILVGTTNNVADYMASADIYIQPSRSEGISLSLIEAASHSLPLIGSDVGGIPEVIHHKKNGLLVKPENVVSLADAVKELIQDAEQRQEFGRNSYKVYEELFSIEEGVRNTIDYYSI